MSDQHEPQPSADDAMQRAVAVQKKYEPILLAMPGVIGVGVGSIHFDDDDTDEIGVIIMVDPGAHIVTEAAAEAITGLPERLDGVPVQIQELGPFTAF